MFWIGLIVALLGGLLSIGLSRERVKSRYSAIGDYHLDVVAILVLVVGLIVSAFDHLGTERTLRELHEKTANRHLSSEQRGAMTPIVAKLKGHAIAVCCRMMDGESCDYCRELVAFFRDAGCRVPDPIQTSLNDFTGFLAITPHGHPESDSTGIVLEAFKAARIPARLESTSESSMGAWYNDTVHIIVGRKSP